jgi:hypothetical protein
MPSRGTCTGVVPVGEGAVPAGVRAGADVSGGLVVGPDGDPDDDGEDVLVVVRAALPSG